MTLVGTHQLPQTTTTTITTQHKKQCICLGFFLQSNQFKETSCLQRHDDDDDDGDDDDDDDDDTSTDTTASTYWYESVFSRPICTDAEELRQTINPIWKMPPCFGLP